MKYLFTIVSLFSFVHPSLHAQTYCMDYHILWFTNAQIVVKVSLMGSAPFNLGDANLVFNFNTNALSAPTLISTTLGNNYSPTTVTNPATGLASINIDYNGAAGQGLAVATLPSEVAQIRFTVNNTSMTTGFSTNANFSVVYKSTSPPTLLDVGANCPILDVTIPLEWLDFQAKAVTEKTIKTVHLDWVTASEQNIQHFIIERSRDSQTFEKVGVSVAAKNTAVKNTYHIIDLNPWSNVSYYRIREVSFNGKESFSRTRTVIFDKDKTFFTIFPNPKIQVSPLSIQTNWTEHYTFNIFEATGKRVYTRTCKGNIELDNVDLPSGFYLYECATPQDKVTGKLIIP